MNNIQGNVWVFGDNIDTDVIIAARYLNSSVPKHLAKYVMQDSNIPDFASKIKNDTRFKHIPILFNSSISGEFSKEKGREVGGDGYLVKFQPKKFYEEVKRVLTRDD